MWNELIEDHFLRIFGEESGKLHIHQNTEDMASSRLSCVLILSMHSASVDLISPRFADIPPHCSSSTTVPLSSVDLIPSSFSQMAASLERLDMSRSLVAAVSIRFFFL